MCVRSALCLYQPTLAPACPLVSTPTRHASSAPSNALTPRAVSSDSSSPCLLAHSSNTLTTERTGRPTMSCDQRAGRGCLVCAGTSSEIARGGAQRVTQISRQGHELT
jgi:hypothetical protein